MDLFTFCLTLGFAGLLVMAMSGLGSRHSAGSRHTGRGHGLHVHRAAPHGVKSHPSGTTAGARAARSGRGGQGRVAVRGGPLRWLAPLFNPQLLFTLSFGFGLFGLLLRDHASEGIVMAGAFAGAIIFERAIVTPMWNLVWRFGSNPALTLESGIMDDALAVTAFDANGQGLISLELDGQVVQVLGTLCPEDRAAGIRVRAGDALIVRDVDARRNRCVVSHGTDPHVAAE